jgi:hypothetical protein
MSSEKLLSEESETYQLDAENMSAYTAHCHLREASREKPKMHILEAIKTGCYLSRYTGRIYIYLLCCKGKGKGKAVPQHTYGEAGGKDA